jgi:hypothetical protein
LEESKVYEDQIISLIPNENDKKLVAINIEIIKVLAEKKQLYEGIMVITGDTNAN